MNSVGLAGGRTRDAPKVGYFRRFSWTNARPGPTLRGGREGVLLRPAPRFPGPVHDLRNEPRTVRPHRALVSTRLATTAVGAFSRTQCPRDGPDGCGGRCIPAMFHGRFPRATDFPPSRRALKYPSEWPRASAGWWRLAGGVCGGQGWCRGWSVGGRAMARTVGAGRVGAWIPGRSPPPTTTVFRAQTLGQPARSHRDPCGCPLSPFAGSLSDGFAAQSPGNELPA
jgi:hypothetical protein